MGSLQFLSQSGNSIFQFGYLFLDVFELCIPTQHGAPPDAPSIEMLSSPGKACQRRTGCHSRGLLPHERCCPRGSMGRSPALTMEIPVFQFGYALLSVI